MKKLLILSVVIFFTSARINAQEDESLANYDNQNSSYRSPKTTMSKRESREERRKLNEADASVQVKEHFIVDFGNIAVDTWKSTGIYDEATFRKDSQVFTAFYDDQSNLVGTSSNKKFSDLPLKAQNYLNKKYADYSVRGVVFFDDNEFNVNNVILHDQPTNGADSYFVELENESHAIVLQVALNGTVTFFTNIH
jgi:hypothetical protein